jgi:hypothetical protein
MTLSKKLSDTKSATWDSMKLRIVDSTPAMVNRDFARDEPGNVVSVELELSPVEQVNLVDFLEEVAEYMEAEILRRLGTD